MCPNGGMVRTKNRRRGPRSRHWKEPVCAEQGEALVTFAALSVQGDFFLPRNFFSALSCKVEFGMCVDPSPRSMEAKYRSYQWPGYKSKLQGGDF